MKWLRIMVYVLWLILNGLGENEAAAKGSGLFDVSVEDILKHL